MSSSGFDTTESRTETLANDNSEPDTQERARRSSDLPEVVEQHSYPEAYGYIRPRIGPGEKEEKILAYDQTGKEVQSDIVSPLSPDTLYSDGQAGNPYPKEPPSEEQSTTKSKHPFRGFTSWRILVLAFLVIAAAVGGGVGGGIAASRSQQASNVQPAVTSNSISPSSTPSSELPLSTSTEPSSSTLSIVSSTSSSAPTESTTSSTEGHCVGTPNGTATGDYLLHGICVSTVTCTSYGGSYISGGCPYNAEDIKCCYVSKCKSTGSFCDWTDNSCNGTYLTGFCPGGSTYRCCD